MISGCCLAVLCPAMQQCKQTQKRLKIARTPQLQPPLVLRVSTLAKAGRRVTARFCDFCGILGGECAKAKHWREKAAHISAGGSGNQKRGFDQALPSYVCIQGHLSPLKWRGVISDANTPIPTIPRQTASTVEQRLLVAMQREIL